MPRKRWLIVSLLFIATTINYMDRILLAVLLPVIRDEFHFDESVYGEITAAFQVAYAVGALICGKVLDRYGTKIGLALSAGIWSVAAILHATVTSPMQFDSSGGVRVSFLRVQSVSSGWWYGSLSITFPITVLRPRHP